MKSTSIEVMKGKLLYLYAYLLFYIYLLESNKEI